MFELDHIDAGYNGTRVLHDISLSIKPGEKVALVGHSGAGKSTLLGLLYEQQAKTTALVPQESGLVKALSVFHNVYIGRLKTHHALYNLVNLLRPFKGELEGIAPILEKLGLTDKTFSPVGELSGGQQQRTAVARALFQGGDVLLGDEIVSALDVHQSKEVLTAIGQAFNTSVLALHDIHLALEFTDRIIGLEGGQIKFDLPSTALTLENLEEFYVSGKPPETKNP